MSALAAGGVTPDLISVPKNHTNPIKIIMTGVGTNFGGTTVMTPDHGTTDHIVALDTEHLEYWYISDPTYEGVVTVQESVTGTAVAYFNTVAATISVDPTTGVTGVTHSITITSTAGVYLQETPSGMYTVNAGATISNIAVVDNNNATADLLLPAGSTGTTITDRTNEDYETAAFGLAAATAYTVSPSPTATAVVDVAKTFSFQANGTTSGEEVTGDTDGTGAWAGTIALDDTQIVQQTYTATDYTDSPHTLSFTNDGALTDPSDVVLTVTQYPDFGTGSILIAIGVI